MDYTEARAILAKLPTLEVKPGLARINRLLEALDHPEHTFPAIHIVGTNGKGSVAAMLASILSHAGYEVGRYTSPELVDFRDRISVNEAWITEEELVAVVEQLLPVLEAKEDRPTQFEALTAIAFEHFSCRRVDLGVVEAGLGGRFDATNVVDPLLTILTNVGRDHLGLLGTTVVQIAWEKAGVAKAAIPFLAGELSPDAERVVREECQRVGAFLIRCDPVRVEQTHFDWESATYAVGASDLPQTIDLPLLGGYQRENLRVVLRSVELLREAGLVVPNSAVTTGLEEVHWPGRFEVMTRRPTVVLDGAHNVPAALALANDVERYVPQKEHRHLLFGILADKEWEEMARILFPLFAEMTLTRSNSPRALFPDLLAQIALSLGIPSTCTATVSEGLARACVLLAQEDVLFVTGSLTVVGEARPVIMEVLCRL